MNQCAGTSRQRFLQPITVIADMMDCDLLAFAFSKHRVRRSVVVNQVNRYRFVMCSEAPDTLDPLPLIFSFSKRRQGVVNQLHQSLRIRDTGSRSFARRRLSLRHSPDREGRRGESPPETVSESACQQQADESKACSSIDIKPFLIAFSANPPWSDIAENRPETPGRRDDQGAPGCIFTCDRCGAK